ncbi:putative bifunctional diguanylate cyclase/phosphodiesterase [Defluviimonas sp. SAOS-178_SWC]|uniref:putative bifunctional diguanylate cyclase/phosphodiesterase n=1 Tax=Defluviimonas sp. SAOS-178_SWC TaxID=3121287 RepID=UPI003221E0FE
MLRQDIAAALHREALRLIQPEFLALYPALAFALLWFGPRGAIVAGVAGVPLAILAQRRRSLAGPIAFHEGEYAVPVPPRHLVTAALDRSHETQEDTGRSSACLVIGLDEPTKLIETYGQEAYDKTLAKVGERLSGVLRERDVLGRVDGALFAIALAPARRMDLEAVIQIAGRLKAAVGEPFSIDAMTVYVSASVGFCLTGRAPEHTGESAFEAASLAYEDARRNGPGGIRAFSADIARAATERDKLRDQVEAALERGEIVAYFQPQLSTDTGDVAGFEALARWQHPERGVLTPCHFLPSILSAGLGERLGEIILGQALAALCGWDRAALRVPSISVNFSGVELRNPNLAAKLKWELDRFDLTPDRLTVEILESVVAETDNDVVVRNINALAKLGCGIDLDDFGTGHASLSSIRRFAVGRIKIDRSYVTRVDTDQSQQRMVAAILSMAERLGLQTLAEGVETIGEHAHLAQLGCTHVQGFAIARPMPLAATEDWLGKHRAKLGATPDLARRAG